MDMTGVITLTAAYILDLVIGDPQWLPHPVKGMGWAIGRMEEVLRRRSAQLVSRAADRAAGVLLAAVIVGATYGIFYFINSMLTASYPAFIVLTVLVATTIATRELSGAGQAVIDEVRSGNMEGARRKLGMIVGRDTKALDDKGVLRAVIETLSENASDGIIAPMFYFAIGGLPLAMAYKAVNTLDSMVGYKNERYRDFGRASARLDDIANYIPARITGILIALSSFIFKLSPAVLRSSLRIMSRDGRKHSSPNSGIPEAAMAGALGVRLGGPSTYGGTVVDKPYIGDENGEMSVPYIDAAGSAVIITRLTSLLGLLTAAGIIFTRNILWN